MIFVGIDPGISGGIAAINDNGKCFFIKTTPCISIKKNNKKKSDYDVATMSAYLKQFVGKEAHVCQELTHAMPGNGGVSMYHFGRGHGIWEGIVGALGLSHIFCTPQKWKDMYPELYQEKLTKEQRALMSASQISSWKRKQKAEAKKKGIELAKKLFPEIASEITQVKHDGMAEALLMANWLRRNYGK
jgi:hypothetical protein